jgi:hypothetical protein
MEAINFTHEQYLRFKQEYAMNKQFGKTNFIFDGSEYFTAYAKYLIEYLDEKFIGKEELCKTDLRKRGYYVDNLWHIDDVKSKYECDTAVAYAVLEKALTNEATMEQIWFAIDVAAENYGLTSKLN